MKRVTADWAVRMAARLRALQWYKDRNRLPFPFGPDGEIDPAAEELHLRAWAWAGQNWLAFVGDVDDEDVRQLLCVINGNGVGAGTWRRRRDRGTR